MAVTRHLPAGRSQAGDRHLNFHDYRDNLVLQAAGHPGLVELVGMADGCLRTRLVEGRSLAELGPLPADEVAGVAAAVAATLADLHDLGLVHDGLDATHVLASSDGRVVLCSLGRPGTPADDVAALGRLVSTLLTQSPARPSPLRTGRHPRPGRRPRSRRARARLGSMLAPAAAPRLATLADDATAADPGRRPSARAFAAAVHQRVPTARLPLPPAAPLLPLPGQRPRPTRPPNSGGWWPELRQVGASVALVVAGLALQAGFLLLVMWMLADRGGGTPPAGRLPPGHPAPSSTSRPAPPAGTAPPPAPPAGAAPPSAPVPATDPVATRVWPVDPLPFADGVLSVDGARYAVGLPGDTVVAGDWACTGRRTLALLRPTTGEVFAFDGWASPGQGLSARAAGRVAGATALRAADVDGDGCDDLEVARHGQPSVRLEMAA